MDTITQIREIPLLLLKFIGAAPPLKFVMPTATQIREGNATVLLSSRGNLGTR